MPIFSFGIIITTVGLILSYLWELYNFTHDYRRSEMLNETIRVFYANHFVLTLCIKIHSLNPAINNNSTK